jgi:hypothetical protein
MRTLQLVMGTPQLNVPQLETGVPRKHVQHFDVNPFGYRSPGHQYDSGSLAEILVRRNATRWRHHRPPHDVERDGLVTTAVAAGPITDVDL